MTKPEGSRAVSFQGGTQYRLEPDYSQPLLEVTGEAAAKLKARLDKLYGAQTGAATYRELERIMRVHRAHATPEILAAEAAFTLAERFTEHDVVLITYGDLIVSPTRSPLKTLADFAEIFFRGIITTLHILPFFPYSSDRGFSVISYEEVDANLGTWEDIGELESAFKLMFDGVVNHVSCKSSWFREFLNGAEEYQDFFIVFSSKTAIDDDRLSLILRPRTSSVLTRFDTIDGAKWVWTTFSEDQIDLNFKHPKVLLKILEVLLAYVRRGADLIRLDAITYLWTELGTSCAHLEETHEVVKLFRDVLDVAAPHVGLITETNVPHEDNITYFGDGRDEAQMVYNFALPPLVLHTFISGSCAVLATWAATLEPPSETTGFFNFLDSHDGIGLMGARGILGEEEIQEMVDTVRAHGGFVSMKSDGDGGESPYELNITWFSALNADNGDDSEDLQVDRFIASRAVALVLRGVPGIYLPSMFGSKNDVESVYRDGSQRSINRAAIQERRLFEAFGDPSSIPARIATRYIDLLEARVGQPAFHPAAEQRVLEADERVLGVLRVARDASSRVLSLINVSADRVVVDLNAAELGFANGGLEDLVGGEAPAVENGALQIGLAPYRVVWLRAREAADGS